MPTRLGAEHWRERAEEARLLAQQMTDAEARSRMLRIANDYDKIADRAATSLGMRTAPTASA
jgi:hypothetical protein